MAPSRPTTISGLMAIAKRTAQRRQQRPTTAHAVLVMLQHDRETSHLLTGQGVREMDLISALKISNEEPESALEVAAERATRLARKVGDGDPAAIHLLAAIVREPRTAGYRCIERTGTNATRLKDDVYGALGLSTGRTRPTVPPVPRARARSNARRRVAETPKNRRVRPPSARRASPPSKAPASRPVDRGTDRPTPVRRVEKSKKSQPPALGSDELDSSRFPLLTRPAGRCLRSCGTGSTSRSGSAR